MGCGPARLGLSICAGPCTQQHPHAIPPTPPTIRCCETWTGAVRGAALRAGSRRSIFVPAFERAIAAHDCRDRGDRRRPGRAPTFANTIEALERSGALLDRVVGRVLQARRRPHQRCAPGDRARDRRRCSRAHWNRIYLNDALFRAIDALHGAARQARPDRRAGARAGALSHHASGAPAPALDDARQGAARRDHRAARHARHRTSARTCWPTSSPTRSMLEGEDDLAGLPDFLRAAARGGRRGARPRRQARHHAVALQRRAVPAVLDAPRSAREGVPRLDRARRQRRRDRQQGASSPRWWRCAPSAPGCSATRRFAALPARRHDGEDAATRCATCSSAVWAPARARRARRPRRPAGADRRPRAATSQLAPWDWRYYAEKLRKARFDLDEAAIKPYLQLDHIIEAAFDTADTAVRPAPSRRRDRHPGLSSRRARLGGDATPTAATSASSSAIISRAPSKHSGAWMTSLRDQEKLDRRHPPAHRQRHEFHQGRRRRADAAVSFDDARTLFHEFGHALHGLLSDVTYPIDRRHQRRDRFRRVAVAALRALAGAAGGAAAASRVHYQTGEPMPGGPAAASCSPRAPSTRASPRSNMSPRRWSISTSTRCSRRDDLDVARVRDATRSTRIGMPEEIVMRHRPPHFEHIFSGDGYASAYYSYMWSEVLDADAFARLRGDRRHLRSGDREEAARQHLFGRRLARPGRALHRVPRPAADAGCAAQAARVGGCAAQT